MNIPQTREEKFQWNVDFHDFLVIPKNRAAFGKCLDHEWRAKFEIEYRNVLFYWQTKETVGKSDDDTITFNFSGGWQGRRSETNELFSIEPRVGQYVVSFPILNLAVSAVCDFKMEELVAYLSETMRTVRMQQYLDYK